jgi:Ca2+-binding RTX toxin-like protein
MTTSGALARRNAGGGPLRRYAALPVPDEQVHPQQLAEERDRDALDGQQREQRRGGQGGQALVALAAAGAAGQARRSRGAERHGRHRPASPVKAMVRATRATHARLIRSLGDMLGTSFACAAAAAAAASALILPAAASAGTADVVPEGADSGVVTYAAAPGETNDVTVAYDGQHVVVHDTGAPVTAGTGCTAVDAHTAACTPDATPLPFARVTLGDGNDRVTVGPGVPGPQLGLLADGGTGNDVLDASLAWNTAVLDGGPGADRLTGGREPDILRDGDDTPDVLDGRGAEDGVDYSARTTGITVDLAKGTTSFGDTLTGIEDAAGGAGRDHLRGDAGDNILDGGRGHDVLSGRGGDDQLGFPLSVLDPLQQGALGGSTTFGDTVYCGRGRDFLNGRTPHEFVAGSCNVVGERRQVSFGTFPILLPARPTTHGRYHFPCSNEEDWDDPHWAALRCAGTLTLRRARGHHRLLARAHIPRGRGVIVARLHWTARGRRLAGRPGGVRARLRMHGHNVPRAGWTLRLRR